MDGGGEQPVGRGEIVEEDRSGSVKDDRACGHRFCRTCIEHHIAELTSNISIASIFDKELVWIFCPYPSCDKELQQHDMIKLVGLPAVLNYQDWMVKYLDILYKPLVSAASSMVCLSAKCDQQNSSAMLVDYVSDLRADEGGIGSSTKGTPPLWVCFTCEASWCSICGIQLSLHPSRHSRLCCDGQKMFSIYTAIGHLKDAFTSRSSNTKCLGKKLLTHTSKSVRNTIWAAGTGFGGGNLENRSYIAPLQSAAKKAELSFDDQVIIAMVTLIEALCPTEAAKDADNICSLNCASCVLIDRDGTLRQVLCHLATNDSMLDICERSG